MLVAAAGVVAPCYGAESNATATRATEKAAVQKSTEEKAAPSSDEKSDGAKAKSEPEIHGIELGKFSVRTHRAVPAQTNRISFTIYATAPAEEGKHFEQLLEHRENKVREQVIVATRLVPVEEFDDAEFTKVRRRILLRLRRALPELIIDGVYISDFNLVVENT